MTNPLLEQPTPDFAELERVLRGEQEPRVRAYALHKTMHAIDLDVELGAKVYVFWGGREGVETDAAKDPVEAIKRTREA